MDELNVRLHEEAFSESEIFLALREVNGDKALGPDGFTVGFWQDSWEIIKEDLQR